jgi:hypothetical protein
MISVLRNLSGFCLLAMALPAFGQSVSFVGVNNQISVSETAGTVTITANLSGGNANPSSVTVELLPLATAASGADFTVPASLTLSWPANSNNVTRTLSFPIANDALPEAAEYFTVRFVNPVNVNLPSTSSNQFTAFILDDDRQAPVASQSVKLNYVSSFSNGASGANSAEIVAYDPGSKRMFIANSVGARLDIVDFSNPLALSLIKSVSVTPYGNINSVAVKNGIVALAIENAVPQQPGKVVFMDVQGNYLNQVTVGAMPDMITFNNGGTRVLTANEGEPNTTYTSDPEGSVSIIDISGGVGSLTQAQVTTADFSAYNSQRSALRASGIRIFGPDSTAVNYVARNLEPEYITVSDDDTKAWVTLQENNAIAELNIATAAITRLLPLGTKDHSLPGDALDGSDATGVVQIANWPVRGVYMPDAIKSFTAGGQTYLVTANEGDAREYNAYTEQVRLSSGAYVLDPTAFPNANVIKANLGRLNVTLASGDTDGDGDFDQIHAFGARSFSIWNAATGARVWDSGDELELIISKHPVFGSIFNASNANNTFKNRSDDKGPEPEGVTTAVIYGRTYAFIALERIGGCMVYDVTDPNAPVFVDYQNNRNPASLGGDLGAEGIIFIRGGESPTGKPYVILANEISSTLTVFEVQVTCPQYQVNITTNPQVTVPGQQANTIFLGYGPQSVLLTANTTPVYEASINYNWPLVPSTQSSVTVSPQAASTYTVVAKDENGCTASATQTIQVIDVRDGNKKIFLCRKGKTLSVSVNAVPAHLANGALLGSCSNYNLLTARKPQAEVEEAVAMNVYPNPAQQLARINIPAEMASVVISVYDLAGRRVARPVNVGGEGNRVYDLNVAGWRNGTYLIQVVSKTGVRQIKLVVMH